MFQAAVQSMFVDWLFANVELVVPNSQQQQQQQLQLQVSENFSPAEKSGLVFEAPQFSSSRAVGACSLVCCVCVSVCARKAAAAAASYDNNNNNGPRKFKWSEGSRTALSQCAH